MVLNWFDEMRKHIFHFMGRRWQHQISRWMVVTTRQHQVMANGSSSSSSSISSISTKCIKLQQLVKMRMLLMQVVVTFVIILLTIIMSLSLLCLVSRYHDKISH